jgi:hypothetical protein
MATQTESSSQHLAAARELLDELEGLTQGGDGSLEAKATTAVAHAILVLAEQVAAARVMMVSDALTQRGNGETAPAAQ